MTARILRRVGYTAGLPAVLVALWWVASAGSDSFFWPPLRTIVATFPDTWLTGRLGEDVLPSVLRLLAGYLLALVLGVALGVPIGLHRRVRAFAEPTLEFFRAIPPPVLVPVIALFAGYTGSASKVVTIAIGCLWPVLLNTVEGVRAVDEVLVDTARCYHLRRRSQLVHLTLRGSSPQIAAGARQALSIGVILMVISELFGADRGLGASIVQFQRSFAIPQMWTGIILLGVLGFLLSLIFRLVEHRALAWYRGLRDANRGA
ncbi:ABC transporter permease subunit [Phycicoccus endophyticus]|uniref:ABC transporter permease subunit n=1 Tax=Phycicoccus endophyticus TaxID=1690220 RepID=A0A7G9R223_9MICO|nr:ABC transporter permease subunit [Phycicoccus endophyticus]NHI19711.1 ABC transporter permease subunit [Phycicoccus endophyticus]QNN49648.1 ABC transporter permease subunit [Phycicoccus endophyticus]GGL33648.1 nitrate ABC transporter permease [Phycicoccus endophyticus]